MKTKQVKVPAKVIEVTFAEYVGSRIRQRRQELGLSLSDIADSIEISRPYLSECERGKRSIGFSKLYQLAAVLGKPTDWFAKGWN